MEWIPKRIRQVYDYWAGLAGGDIPSRAQFDIASLRPVLPYLMLCEFEHAPFRVRFRLSGTMIDQMTGMNLTGRYLDEFATGDYASSITQMIGYYEEASQTGRPRVWSYPWAGNNPNSKVIWVGLFPLKVDGKICQCISIEDYGELSSGGPVILRRQRPTDWAGISKPS
jgi:hypothetical protein